MKTLATGQIYPATPRLDGVEQPPLHLFLVAVVFDDELLAVIGRVNDRGPQELAGQPAFLDSPCHDIGGLRHGLHGCHIRGGGRLGGIEQLPRIHQGLVRAHQMLVPGAFQAGHVCEARRVANEIHRIHFHGPAQARNQGLLSHRVRPVIAIDKHIVIHVAGRQLMGLIPGDVHFHVMPMA